MSNELSDVQVLYYYRLALLMHEIETVKDLQKELERRELQCTE